MPNRKRVACLFLAAGLAVFAPVGRADTFVVDDGGYSNDIAPGNGTCADSGGKCTLNAAIQEGNFRSGSHTITFTVPIVTLQGALADIRAPFTITGTLPARTILNGNNFPCVSLTDSGDPGTGHQLGADGSSVLNMVINNCNGHGISANGHGYTFANNYIGTDPTGTAAVKNKGQGISISSSRVYSQVTSQFLLDLYATFPVQPVSYADIATFASQLTTILANAQLGPVTITANVISGNQGHGIEIFSQNLAGVFVTLNMIGTDPTGNVAVPNELSGVRFVGEPFANMIGPDNVISGNLQHGIQNDAGNVSLPNYIMGNRVGLASLNPGADLGNGLSGITADTKPDTSVGHINPSGIALIIGPANNVSDNKGANNPLPDVLGADNGGILVTGASKGIKILGNVIGIGEFPLGTPVASKAYGNAGDGIIVTVSDVEIGGTSSGNGNVIAANARHGIVIKGSSVTGTKVQGNSIGVHPGLAGNLAIGNGADGIHNNAASTAVMGGAGSTDFNTIAGNGRNGVAFRNGNPSNGWANLLQRNQIYGNAKALPGIGIDLDFLENASNPLHSEFFNGSYAQRDQAQPAICTGAPGEPAACSGFTPPSAGAGTSLDWTIQTHGPATFRMEFFKIDTADANTSTSMTFLGEQTVTTDITGKPNSAGCTGGRCSSSVGGSAAGGYIVMTANDVTPITNMPGGGWMDTALCIVFTSCFVNDTSEFSNTALPSVVTTTAVTSVAPSTSVFGQPVNVTATVSAAAGAPPTGSVTITAGASSCNAALGSPVGSASSATCTLAPNPAVGGPIAVTASYSGQGNFLASASSGAGNGSLTVNKADTVSVITADTPDPSNVNSAYAVTASVSVVAPGAGTPGGAITVSDGTDNCVIALPATSCNLTSTTVGAKLLVATYAGDASFNGSASPGVPHTVNSAGPTPTATSVTLVNPAVAVYGQPVAVTVQVTAGGGVVSPDGSVNVTVGASSCIVTLAPVGGLVSGGTCNLAPAPAVGVAQAVSAAYAGSASFSPSSASNGSLTVNKANTTTVITGDTPDPSTVNQAYAVTAVVTPNAPGAGTPGGTVMVSDGTDNCVITLPAPSCNLTSTTSGAKTLTATYSGDASFNVSVSAGAAHTVNPAGPTATTTAVTLVNPSTAVYGQAVAVTVQVTAGSGAVAPNGSVTVTAGASTCNATLAPVGSLVAGGSCNLAPAPAVGAAQAVSASYAGNASFAASASSGAGNGSLTVNKASTSTAITADTPDPSNVNAAYSVTAVVTVTAPGAGAPAGTVTVSDGSANCVITLPATSCNLTSTTTGAKTLTATYSGDASFNGSVSPGVPHQVNPGGATPTTTAVTLVNPSTAVYGQAVAVTVQVTAGSGAAAPDGSVTVTAGAGTCSATLAPVGGLVAGGSCNLAPAPGAGAYTVSASYAGNATFAGSSSSGAGNGSLTVNKASTTATITGDTPDPSNVNAAYAVTVTIAVTAPGSGAPTGTVTVTDGTDSCVITLPAPTCNLTSTTTGAKTLTATYAGDPNFNGSVSPGVPHQVDPGGATPTTTAVTLVNPATSVFGQPVSVTVQVTAGSGGMAPDGSVSLTAGASTCNVTLAPAGGLVAGGSCNLAPPPGAQVGAYTVSASYAGNATFAASASSGAGNGSLTVNKATTTVTVSDAPDPTTVGASYAVTSSVAVTAPGAGTPSGTINVSDGTDSCAITLPATSCTLTSTTGGAKTLTAQYGGDANFVASNATTSHTVNVITSFSGSTIAPGVTGTATLTGGGPNCSLVNPQFIAVAPLTPPPGVAFPFGLFDFSATGCTVGGTITIQIVYSQPLPAGSQYWKYGPAPGNLAPHWYLMPGASVSGNTVTFSITDGGFGDDDVTANGTIVDQGGPGAPGSGGGATVPIPTLGEYAILLLAALLVSIGALRLRRRM